MGLVGCVEGMGLRVGHVGCVEGMGLRVGHVGCVSWLEPFECWRVSVTSAVDSWFVIRENDSHSPSLGQLAISQ